MIKGFFCYILILRVKCEFVEFKHIWLELEITNLNFIAYKCIPKINSSLSSLLFYVDGTSNAYSYPSPFSILKYI